MLTRIPDMLRNYAVRHTGDTSGVPVIVKNKGDVVAVLRKLAIKRDDAAQRQVLAVINLRDRKPRICIISPLVTASDVVTERRVGNLNRSILRHRTNEQ